MANAVRSFVKKILPRRVVHSVVRARHGWPETPTCPLPGARYIRTLTGERPYFFSPLENPEWVTAKDAIHLEHDDAVLGFEAEGKAWAVPWDVMAAHHAGNLVLEGRPYLITLCDACTGGGLFDPVVDGERLLFRMEGMYNGTPFLSDDRTGSLWTMVTMKPVHGDAILKGPLQRLPMVHASWTEWRRLHPETLVVNDPGEPDGGHGDSHRWAGHDTLPGFSTNTRLTPVDPRIGPIDIVVGVVVNASARCYPLDLLHEKSSVVNDVVGGRPVVVITIPGTYIALILYREVDDVVLELEWEGGPEAAVAAVTNDSEPPLLVDRATGTRWNLFGTAVDGPLAGAQLAHAWGGAQKWFNWSNQEPRSEIWGVDAHLGGGGGPWTSSVPGGVRGEPRAIELARRSASEARDHVDAVGKQGRRKKRREVTDHVH